MEIHTVRVETNRQTDRHTDLRTDGRTDRQTDRQTYRQADRQLYYNKHCIISLALRNRRHIKQNRAGYSIVLFILLF